MAALGRREFTFKSGVKTQFGDVEANMTDSLPNLTEVLDPETWLTPHAKRIGPNIRTKRSHMVKNMCLDRRKCYIFVQPEQSTQSRIRLKTTTWRQYPREL